VSEDVGGGGDGRGGKRGRVRRLGRGGRSGGRGGGSSNEDGKPHTAEVLETRSDGGDALNQDEMQEQVRLRMRAVQKYKIQEVIRRRQILLVQVTKEERGTKGAALTTYISLAGRYCVLMPNTVRGGGVSRKITSAADRKRLKTVIEDLDVPFGMSVILRTAGMERNKAEIKRDFEYLLRLWDNIRVKTLASIAPCLIYEEANLIRRSIRDLYARDIDEVLIQGDGGYRIGKDFMKMLMPSHARRVQQYKGETPLFHVHGVEGQIDAMYSQTVQLRSGGYIVIDQTEALVAIDVNSGRSTRERNIEETATRTNLEAAEEVARQLRLRDLAGLIVIDFIDMEENRNDQAVERRLREAMKNDRARIQIGRISPFGLMELSRQRLRPSLSETTYVTCPHCAGSGLVRTSESAALSVLRAVEAFALVGPAAELIVHTPTAIALYVLNQKRDVLARIEQTYGMRVILEQDNSMVEPFYRLERTQAMVAHNDAGVIQQAEFYEERGASAAAPAATPSSSANMAVPDAAPSEPAVSELSDGNDKKGRRPRGEKPGAPPAEIADQPAVADDTGAEQSDQPSARASEFDDDGDPNDERRRRRGKRGGRRRGRRRDEMVAAEQPGSPFNEAASIDLADAPQPSVVFPGVEPLPSADGSAVNASAKTPAVASTDVADIIPPEPLEPAEPLEPIATVGRDTDGDDPPDVITEPVIAPTEVVPQEPLTATATSDQEAAIKITRQDVATDVPAETLTEQWATSDQPTPDHTTVIEVGGTDESQPKRRGWFNRIFS
jgi:ribonuclease E